MDNLNPKPGQQQRSIDDPIDAMIKQMKKIGGPQTEGLKEIALEFKKNQQRISQSVTQLSEVLDYLRIVVKYQAFDLEATRRENAYQRRIIQIYEERDKKEGRDKPQYPT